LSIKEINVNSLASIGTATTKQSKSISNGNFNTYTYIVADQPAVFITILRYFIETIQLPENTALIENALNSQDAGGFGSYGKDLVNNLTNKTVDEAIEWLKDLLFSERVVVEEEVVEDYNPTIIYQEKEENHTLAKVIIGIVISQIVIWIIIFLNRKRMFEEDTKKC
jgi:hypothetical protein